MNHEVRLSKKALFHGPTFMVSFLKKSIYKVYGPSLSVNRMWIKRNDHAQNTECVGFKKKIQKINFEKKEKNNLTFLLSSSSMCQKTNHSIFIITTSLFHGPLSSYTIAIFCLSHHKTLWIISMDNVGFNVCLKRTSYSMATRKFYSLV